MEEQELIPHLFRTEYRKIVTVLGKLFGFEHIETAEDISSDTFLLAAETWGQKGIPPNPVAWLYTVAKNKAKNHLKRDTLFAKAIRPAIKHLSGTAGTAEPEIDLSEKNINDSQLQMMFAICHPLIPVEAQIGLSLKILCGFGIEEIADAFLTGKDTIYKRLSRAKEILKTEKVEIELPGASEIDQRLEAVLATLYLLFNEGYYSNSQNSILRKDLCLEAIRLNYLIVENPQTDTPPANALLSLMCFHASRFEARIGQNGEIILYDKQDESLWNKELMEKGEYYLNRSATGTRLSKYHLEAAIAYWHTYKMDSREKWENILQLYNQLLQIQYSPIAALNRTYALAKANGVSEGITEAEKLRLTNNHFYFTLLGELYTSIDKEKAKGHFLSALVLAKSQTDKSTIQGKIDRLDKPGNFDYI
jgi:predicted RNA polymerase sigma factor